MKLHIFLLAILTGLVLFSCGDTPKSVDDLTALGGKKYGGEFRFMSYEKIQSLASISSGDQYSSRLVTQIYEPILQLNKKSMNVTPGIAESYDVSEDAKVYTLKIRKGITFHKNECFGKKLHELDAEDVKFTLEMACSQLPLNKINYLLVNRIEGAQEFYNNSKESLPKEGVSGIKKIDNYTLQITLKEPFAGFDKILTHPSLGVFPREAYEKYGADLGKNPVGTGPFQLETFEDEKIVLKRNDNYWKKDDFGNQLPFLSKVIVTYAKDKRSEFLAFRKSEVDLVLEIPVEEVEHILGTLQEAQDGKNIKHKVESESSMSIHYIGFNNESEAFKDINVRKAFNLAINKNEIIDVSLEGEGYASLHGIVPEMGNYPIEKVKGYKYNVAQAKQLMAKAGFPNGKGFPTINFYVGGVEGSKGDRLAHAIVDQLKANLNIEINIVRVTMAERNELLESGTAEMWLEGWLADYPDPENFLSLLYRNNKFNFNNTHFFECYEKSITESDEAKRNKLYVECDQIIVDEAAIIPVFTDDNTIMVNARVREFEINELEILDLTSVFIKEAKKK